MAQFLTQTLNNDKTVKIMFYPDFFSDESKTKFAFELTKARRHEDVSDSGG
jgi:hypothetical protein